MAGYFTLKYTNHFATPKAKQCKNPKKLSVEGSFAIRNYDERDKNKPDYLPKDYIKVTGSYNMNNTPKLEIEEGNELFKKTGDVVDFSYKKAAALEYIATIDNKDNVLSKEDVLNVNKDNKELKKLGVTKIRKSDEGVLTLVWGDKDILRIDFRSNEVTKNNNSSNEKASNKEKKQGLNDFYNALAMRESSGICTKENELGYIGLFQFGEPALKDLGLYKETKNKATRKNDWKGVVPENKYGIKSISHLMCSPEKQIEVVKDYHKLQWNRIKAKKLIKYINTTVNGIPITPSGMIAASHLVGVGNLEKFLETLHIGTFLTKDYQRYDAKALLASAIL